MALARLQYFSAALGKQTSATLLIPEVEIEPPYIPWLLLHGLSDDDTMWSRRTNLERCVERLPMLVVMPDGGRGFYRDAFEGFAYETALAEELPVMIERYFPVKPVWAVGGLSMGGYGAMRFGLAHPDRFRSVHSHSGALGFDQNPRYQDQTEFARIIGPKDTSGLYQLASDLKSPISIRIDCGTEDFLIEDNREFSAYLDELNVEHEYEEFSGAHDWTYWDLHIQDQIDFHLSNLKSEPY